NISEWIKPRIDVEEAIDLVKEQGGTVLLPHPFSLLRRKVGGKILRILDRVDLVEVINGRSFLIDNLLSKRLAEKANKPGVGGSDAHFYFEIGSVSVDLSEGLHNPGPIVSKRFRFRIIPMLLSGVVNLIGRRNFLLSHFHSPMLANALILVSVDGKLWVTDPEDPSRAFRLRIKRGVLLPDESCVMEAKSIDVCLKLKLEEDLGPSNRIPNGLRSSVNDLIINDESRVTHLVLDDKSIVPLTSFSLSRGNPDEV
ncbi:MAG: hypothetical protein DRO05_06410, partial [Thermoproteota archaeon]